MDFRGQWKPLKNLPKRPLALFVDLHAAISGVAKKSSLMSTPDEDGVGFYEILYFDSDAVFAMVVVDSETSEIVVAAPMPPGIQSHVLDSRPFSRAACLELWEEFDVLTAGPNSLIHVWKSSTSRTRAEIVRTTSIARQWRRSISCILCGEPIPFEEIEETNGYEYDLHGVRIVVEADGSAVSSSSGFRCSSCVSRAWMNLKSYQPLEIWALSPSDAAIFQLEGVPASYLRDVATTAHLWDFVAESSRDFRFSLFNATEIATLFRLGVKPHEVAEWLDSSLPFKLIEIIIAARPGLSPLRDEFDDWLDSSEKIEKRSFIEVGLASAHGDEDWPVVARELVERGVRASSLTGWLLTGLEVEAVIRFISLGLSSEDFDAAYSDWTDWELEIDEFTSWVRKIQAASKRLPEAVKEEVDLLPVGYSTWAEVGITNAGEALMWFEAGFSPSLLTHDGVDPYTRHGGLFSLEDAGVIRNAWMARQPRDWDALVLKFPEYLDAIAKSTRIIDLENIGDWFALPPGLIEPIRNEAVSPRTVLLVLNRCAKDEVCLGDDAEPNWLLIEDTVQAIIDAGLPVTFNNVEAWYGYQSDEILAAIDSGLTTSSMRLVKQGLTQSQVDAYARLVDGGLDAERAMEAIHDGFDLRQVEMWEGEGLAGAVRYFRNSLVGLGAGIPIAEAHAWWKAGFTVSSFSPKRPVGPHTDWRICGFKPSEARKWALAGFIAVDAETLKRGGLTPVTARSWIDAGFEARRAVAWSKHGIPPEIARRREQAGINP